jgi:hypothetical protein
VEISYFQDLDFDQKAPFFAAAHISSAICKRLYMVKIGEKEEDP